MTTIGSVVKTDIVQIRMFYIKEIMNLNGSTFDEVAKYNIFP